MLGAEISILERVARVCGGGRIQFSYPERVEIERAILNSASLVARKYHSVELTGFSMSARDAVERALAQQARNQDSANALRMAFELAAVLGTLCSTNPYTQKELMGDTGRDGDDAFVGFGRRIGSYCRLLAALR